MNKKDEQVRPPRPHPLVYYLQWCRTKRSRGYLRTEVKKVVAAAAKIAAAFDSKHLPTTRDNDSTREQPRRFIPHQDNSSIHTMMMMDVRNLSTLFTGWEWRLMRHIDTIMKALPWKVLHGYTANSDHAYGWNLSYNDLNNRLTAAKTRIVVVPWTQYASTIFVDTQKRRIRPSIEEDSCDDTATEEKEEDAGKNFKPRSSSNNIKTPKSKERKLVENSSIISTEIKVCDEQHQNNQAVSSSTTKAVAKISTTSPSCDEVPEQPVQFYEDSICPPRKRNKTVVAPAATCKIDLYYYAAASTSSPSDSNQVTIFVVDKFFLLLPEKGRWFLTMKHTITSSEELLRLKSSYFDESLTKFLNGTQSQARKKIDNWKHLVRDGNKKNDNTTSTKESASLSSTKIKKKYHRPKSIYDALILSKQWSSSFLSLSTSTISTQEGLDKQKSTKPLPHPLVQYLKHSRAIKREGYLRTEVMKKYNLPVSSSSTYISLPQHKKTDFNLLELSLIHQISTIIKSLPWQVLSGATTSADHAYGWNHKVCIRPNIVQYAALVKIKKVTRFGPSISDDNDDVDVRKNVSRLYYFIPKKKFKSTQLSSHNGNDSSNSNCNTSLLVAMKKAKVNQKRQHMTSSVEVASGPGELISVKTTTTTSPHASFNPSSASAGPAVQYGSSSTHAPSASPHVYHDNKHKENAAMLFSSSYFNTSGDDPIISPPLSSMKRKRNTGSSSTASTTKAVATAASSTYHATIDERSKRTANSNESFKVRYFIRFCASVRFVL